MVYYLYSYLLPKLLQGCSHIVTIMAVTMWLQPCDNAGEDISIFLYISGYSDPYVIVKYGEQEVYRTQHIPKTLNPRWNCQCTLSAPPPNVPIIIVR